MDASGAAARCMALLSGKSGTEISEPSTHPSAMSATSRRGWASLPAPAIPTIDQVVDVDSVLDFAARTAGVVHTQVLPMAACRAARRRSAQAIREHNLNRIVIGACTPRTHLALFHRRDPQDGLNPQLLEFVSLRDNCAWVHGDDPQGATRKAKEEMRVGVARVRHLQPYSKEQAGLQPLGPGDRRRPGRHDRGTVHRRRRL